MATYTDSSNASLAGRRGAMIIAVTALMVVACARCGLDTQQQQQAPTLATLTAPRALRGGSSQRTLQFITNANSLFNNSPRGQVSGSATFTGSGNSIGSTTGGDISQTGSLTGSSTGGASIRGPDGSAVAQGTAGGKSASANTIDGDPAVADPANFSTTTAIFSDIDFGAQLGPVTGGFATGTGTLALASLAAGTPVGTGTGITVKSGNTASNFAGGSGVATNQFGTAGGTGSGQGEAASGAGGSGITPMAGPASSFESTGSAKTNFDNTGAGFFALPSATANQFGTSNTLGIVFPGSSTTTGTGTGGSTNGFLALPQFSP